MPPSNQPRDAVPGLINQNNHAGGEMSVSANLQVSTDRPAYERILNALEAHGRRVRHVGPGRARSNCPGHDGDNQTALSIRDGETRVSLTCHTQGCDGEVILNAIGLRVADRYHEPKAKYVYEVNGIPVRTVIRDAATKRFHQTGIVGNPTLYRLDRLAGAETVYLVEGEEDVHALEAAGVVATTAPMGAENLTKTDLTPLYGKTIIAVVDDDRAGQKWAAAVREALGGHADLTLVGAKIGKDASDHLAAGLGVEDFKLYPPPPNENDTHTRQLTLTRASDITVRPVHWLWAARIALGTLVLLGGREGIGKSTIAYTIAALVTRGRLPGRHFGQPKAVIVAATEDSWAHTIVPRLMAAGAWTWSTGSTSSPPKASPPPRACRETCTRWRS